MKTLFKYSASLALLALMLSVSLYAEDRLGADRSRFGLSLGYGAPHLSHFTFAGSGASASGRGHAVQGRFEWMALELPVGSIALGAGFGFALSPRTVTVAADAPSAEELRKDPSIESVDRSNVLLTLPIETYISYRAQFVPDQVLVPFFRIGPSLTFVRQGSNSGAPEASGKFFGLEYAAGLHFLLNALDRGGAKSLRTLTGVRQTYLSAEYARTASLGVQNPDSLDLRGDTLRLAFRFQF